MRLATDALFLWQNKLRLQWNIWKFIISYIEIWRLGFHYFELLQDVFHTKMWILMTNRNCLVDSNYGAKIACFDISSKLYPGDYFTMEDGRYVPLRWMAWESVTLVSIGYFLKESVYFSTLLSNQYAYCLFIPRKNLAQAVTHGPSAFSW